MKTNAYSVPARVGTEVEARLGPAHVSLWQDGRCLARHERSYGRHQQVLNLEHYLDVLERKPGALAGSTPLAQCRARGLWPAAFDALWGQLMARYGKQDGTRQMIAVLQLGRQHGMTRMAEIAAQALSLGCIEEAAIRHLVAAERLVRPTVPAVPVGALTRYDRPAPTMAGYDQLLTVEVPA
ncbi:MAG: hypothetical protein EHM13_06710 [Acidobacteria bacterium]|nr:MAG: hypothetical protein EHM13_06710 [Acidobacteriota bacterium]